MRLHHSRSHFLLVFSLFSLSFFTPLLSEHKKRNARVPLPTPPGTPSLGPAPPAQPESDRASAALRTPGEGARGARTVKPAKALWPAPHPLAPPRPEVAPRTGPPAAPRRRVRRSRRRLRPPRPPPAPPPAPAPSHAALRARGARRGRRGRRAHRKHGPRVASRSLARPLALFMFMPSGSVTLFSGPVKEGKARRLLPDQLTRPRRGAAHDTHTRRLSGRAEGGACACECACVCVPGRRPEPPALKRTEGAAEGEGLAHTLLKYI